MQQTTKPQEFVIMAVNPVKPASFFVKWSQSNDAVNNAIWSTDPSLAMRFCDEFEARTEVMMVAVTWRQRSVLHTPWPARAA